MIFADIVDTIAGHLCFGTLIFGGIVWAVCSGIGSAAESVCKSDTAKEVAKGFIAGVLFSCDDDDDDDDD